MITKRKILLKLSESKKLISSLVWIFKLGFFQNTYFNVGFLLFISLTALVPLTYSYFWAKIIDALTNAASNPLDTNSLYFYVGAFFMIVVLDKIINSFTNYFEIISHLRISRNNSIILAKKFSQLELQAYEDPEVNKLIQKVDENYFRANSIIDKLFWSIYDFTSLIISTVILFSLSPIILILLLLGNIPTLVNQIALGDKAWGIWDAESTTRREFWSTRAYLKELSYFQEVRVHNLTNFLLNKFTYLNDKFLNKQLKLEKRRLFSEVLLGFLSSVFYIFSYAFLIYKVVGGIITIGLFTFYSSRIETVSRSLKSIFRFVGNMYEDSLFISEYRQFLNLKSNLKNGTRLVGTFPNSPLIEFKNVWFKYPGTKTWVLRNFNFTMGVGEHIAIVGENGAGKTTLIKLLLRSYDIDKGEILINNKSIKTLNRKDWFKYLSPLMQNFATFHYDVKTNVALSDLNKKVNFEKVVKSTKMSGAHEFVDKYPKKYKQLLRKSFPNGIDPSWGQWQKIALARSFYKDSPILILDEPTSAIDPKAEYEIFQKLFDFAKNKTVIIISHRFSTVRNADRIIVLDNGKIVEEGSHAQLIAKGGMYKEAYDLQKKGYEDI
ncbi:ABC transporter ATP-binding protein [bacterium]|nr:ABC transporter ATP-binding protein [bacterium]